MKYKILALLLLIYSATFAQKFTLDANCEPVQTGTLAPPVLTTACVNGVQTLSIGGVPVDIANNVYTQDADGNTIVTNCGVQIGIIPAGGSTSTLLSTNTSPQTNVIATHSATGVPGTETPILETVTTLDALASGLQAYTNEVGTQFPICPVLPESWIICNPGGFSVQSSFLGNPLQSITYVPATFGTQPCDPAAINAAITAAVGAPGVPAPVAGCADYTAFYAVNGINHTIIMNVSNGANAEFPGAIEITYQPEATCAIRDVVGVYCETPEAVAACCPPVVMTMPLPTGEVVTDPSDAAQVNAFVNAYAAANPDCDDVIFEFESVACGAARRLAAAENTTTQNNVLSWDEGYVFDYLPDPSFPIGTYESTSIPQGFRVEDNDIFMKSLEYAWGGLCEVDAGGNVVQWHQIDMIYPAGFTGLPTINTQFAFPPPFPRLEHRNVYKIEGFPEFEVIVYQYNLDASSCTFGLPGSFSICPQGGGSCVSLSTLGVTPVTDNLGNSWPDYISGSQVTIPEGHEYSYTVDLSGIGAGGSLTVTYSATGGCSVGDELSGLRAVNYTDNSPDWNFDEVIEDYITAYDPGAGVVQTRLNTVLGLPLGAETFRDACAGGDRHVWNLNCGTLVEIEQPITAPNTYTLESVPSEGIVFSENGAPIDTVVVSMVNNPNTECTTIDVAGVMASVQTCCAGAPGGTVDVATLPGISAASTTAEILDAIATHRRTNGFGTGTEYTGAGIGKHNYIIGERCEVVVNDSIVTPCTPQVYSIPDIYFNITSGDAVNISPNDIDAAFTAIGYERPICEGSIIQSNAGGCGGNEFMNKWLWINGEFIFLSSSNLDKNVTATFADPASPTDEEMEIWVGTFSEQTTVGDYYSYEYDGKVWVWVVTACGDFIDPNGNLHAGVLLIESPPATESLCSGAPGGTVDATASVTTYETPDVLNELHAFALANGYGAGTLFGVENDFCVNTVTLNPDTLWGMRNLVLGVTVGPVPVYPSSDPQDLAEFLSNYQQLLSVFGFEVTMRGTNNSTGGFDITYFGNGEDDFQFFGAVAGLPTPPTGTMCDTSYFAITDNCELAQIENDRHNINSMTISGTTVTLYENGVPVSTGNVAVPSALCPEAIQGDVVVACPGDPVAFPVNSTLYGNWELERPDGTTMLWCSDDCATNTMDDNCGAFYVQDGMGSPALGGGTWEFSDDYTIGGKRPYKVRFVGSPLNSCVPDVETCPTTWEFYVLRSRNCVEPLTTTKYIVANTDPLTASTGYVPIPVQIDFDDIGMGATATIPEDGTYRISAGARVSVTGAATRRQQEFAINVIGATGSLHAEFTVIVMNQSGITTAAGGNSETVKLQAGDLIRLASRRDGTSVDNLTPTSQENLYLEVTKLY